MKKIIIKSETLLDMLTIVSKAIEKKQTVVILENFLFEIRDQLLIVSGSDLQTSIRVTEKIQCVPKLQFDAVVPVEIMKYLKTLNGNISITWDESKYSLELLAGSERAKYSGDNPGDFPKLLECNKLGFTLDTTLFNEFKD